MTGRGLTSFGVTRAPAFLNRSSFCYTYNMDSTAPNLLVTPQQYLTFEEGSSERHEYVDGLVYALPGESRKHNQVAGKLYALLLERNRDPGCWVAFEGVKLWIPTVNRYYYPDVMVLCDPRDTDDKIFQYPCFVAEIHSPSTRATDKREKLQAYRGIETLQGYLMVDHEERVLEYVVRGVNGWRSQRLEAGTLEIACLNAAVNVADVFEV